MKNVMNTGFCHGGVKPSCNATFPDLIKKFFENIKKKCCELSLVNNKQANDNKVDSPLTIHKRQLSWIIASLGQVVHFTSVVIRNDNKVDSPLTTHNSLVKAIAFTLAETLVVMGIIGVVAALTIPNLNQSTGDREKVAKLKKVYSNLEDAFGRATAVYGPVDEWSNGVDANQEVLISRFTDRITEFMKISKKVNFDTFISADGAEFTVGSYSDYVGDNSNHYPNMKYYGDVYVDIDGPNKGKNKDSYDRFEFSITDQGIFPSNTQYYVEDFLGDDGPCANAGGGYYYCTAWVIINGNMDYLKCYDELSWSGKTSCK